MRKGTVEESYVLDAADLKRQGALRSGYAASLTWTRAGKPDGSIGIRADDDGLWLSYTTSSQRQGYSGDQHYHIMVTRVPAAIGGERAFFGCPGCHEPVRKVYLPPSALTFLCRGCHELSYRSRRVRKGSFLWLWRRLNELEREAAKPMTPRRWLALMRETAKLREALAARDPLPSMIAAAAKLEAWVSRQERGPGRPSKRELREQERASRAQRAAEAAQIEKRPPGRPKEKRPYRRRVVPILSPRLPAGQAYCVRCHDRRELVRGKLVTLANGRPALRGRCGTCRAGMQRIVSRAASLVMSGNVTQRGKAGAAVALAG